VPPPSGRSGGEIVDRFTLVLAGAPVSLGDMKRFAVVVAYPLLLVACSASAPASAPAAAPAQAAQTAAKPVPNAPPGPPPTGPCTLALTAPLAFSRGSSASDPCTLVAASTTAPGAHPHDSFLFEARKASPLTTIVQERSFTIAVDPTLGAGSTVDLTPVGGTQLTDQVLMGYVEHANGPSTYCNHWTGKATVVTPRPNLDVTFDLTCTQAGAAESEKLTGEFTSTL
jgi:hypothetical protein